MSAFYKKTPVRTYSSIILQLTAVVLFYYDHRLPAQLIAIAACTLAAMDVPVFTGWLQNLVGITAVIVLGQTIEFGSGSFPLLSISLFFGTIAILVRLIFFNSMLHTKALWLDPLLMIISFAFYVAGNILYDHSWQGWLLPLPSLLFSTKLIVSFIIEGRKYLSVVAQGYKAEMGKLAPDFSLPDTDGKTISLSSFRGSRHILLLFIRGDWCPACHVMLRTYERKKEKFQEKNVFLIAVGPDPVGVNRDMAERIGIDYSILADEQQKTAAMYGVRIEKDPILRDHPTTKQGLPLPASFLICDKGIVRYHSSPERVGEFLHPEYVFSALEKI